MRSPAEIVAVTNEAVIATDIAKNTDLSDAKSTGQPMRADEKKRKPRLAEDNKGATVAPLLKDRLCVVIPYRLMTAV